MFSMLYNIIIYPLIQIIEVVYLVVWKVFKNSGYAVMGVSVAVTFLCLPLYVVAESWQEKERAIQKKMQSTIDRIKAVFKGDERYMILSTYYKQNGYHPMMALRSSFGLLIQIPFFIAAYTYLSHLEELKGFQFFFIRDMGAPDALFSIGNFGVNILPIAMTLINCIAGAIYTKGFQLRDKLQVYGMAAIFLVLLYNSPAGLVLYWTMNNVFSLAKNIFYKLKNPLKALYVILCIGAVGMGYYLLFIHHGFLHRRLMLLAVIALIPLSPLVIKFINYLIKTLFAPLLANQRQCLYLFILSATILCLLLGLVLPSFVIESSPQEFSFIDTYKSPFTFLGLSFSQALGFLLFWPICIYFLFNKKIKVLCCVLFSVLSISALINAFIFVGNYGILSPILTFSNAGLLKATNQQNMINLLILLLPLLVIFTLIKLHKSQWLATFSTVLLMALICITTVNCAKINTKYTEYQELRADLQETKKTELSPVFHLTKTGKNVFVLMLDRSLGSFIPFILDEKPELSSIFDGFIHYPNTLSYADHTLIGAPPLFGGYDYTPLNVNKRDSEPLVEKHNEALLSMPVLFLNNGFDVTVTDASWANYSWISDLRIYNSYPRINAIATIRTYTDLWLQQHPNSSEQGVRSSLMKRNFIWYSFLRVMPTMFRDTIYNDGFWWNTNKSFEDLQDVVNNYASLDYLPELTDFTAQNDTYTFTVNEMTHEPNYLQAPNYEPQAVITNKGKGPFAEDIHYHANIGALLRVAEWIEYLKQNGVYDNTRILIVADHGANIQTGACNGKTPMRVNPEAFNPLLLVKDFNSHGTLKFDKSFMTNADVPYLSVNGLIDNPKNPFTQNPINMEPKKKPIFVTDSTLWSPDGQYKNTFKINDSEWFTVRDDIFKSENWQQEVPTSR